MNRRDRITNGLTADRPLKLASRKLGDIPARFSVTVGVPRKPTMKKPQVNNPKKIAVKLDTPPPCVIRPAKRHHGLQYRPTRAT